MNIEEPVLGLERLPRERRPDADLWPGIEARLKPRRRYTPWLGLALAASLTALVVLPLRMPGPAPASGVASQQARYFAAQLRVVHGAERELRRALEQQPSSDSLRRLLETTRQRERHLQRSLTAHT